MHNIYDQLKVNNFVKLTLKLSRLDNGKGLSQWFYVYEDLCIFRVIQNYFVFVNISRTKL